MTDINLILQKCITDNDIKVYPVFENYKWFIEARIKGRKKRFEKPVEYKHLNESIIKTYKFFAEKL